MNKSKPQLLPMFPHPALGHPGDDAYKLLIGPESETQPCRMGGTVCNEASVPSEEKGKMKKNKN